MSSESRPRSVRWCGTWHNAAAGSAARRGRSRPAPPRRTAMHGKITAATSEDDAAQHVSNSVSRSRSVGRRLQSLQFLLDVARPARPLLRLPSSTSLSRCSTFATSAFAASTCFLAASSSLVSRFRATTGMIETEIHDQPRNIFLERHRRVVRDLRLPEVQSLEMLELRQLLQPGVGDRRAVEIQILQLPLSRSRGARPASVDRSPAPNAAQSDSCSAASGANPAARHFRVGQIQRVDLLGNVRNKRHFRVTRRLDRARRTTLRASCCRQRAA